LVGGGTGWASHAAELYWAFGMPSSCLTNSSERALTAAMQSYWGSFAREGRPRAGDGSAEWTQYHPSERNTLILDFEIRMERDWKAQDCGALMDAAAGGRETWPCLLS
jgi:carboxylesterase type B